MATAEEYVERAAAAIVEILDEHHAVVHPEVEARICERYYTGSRENIDPHHVTTALRELGNDDVITWDRAKTRGGQDITTIQPVHRGRRATKVDSAAARKRLLLTRYHGWSQGSARYPQGLIGPAGEAAVRGAILAAGTLQPAQPDAGEVSEILRTKLPGSVDSAGFMVPFNDGIPQPPVTLLIEVKNIRSWIYPNSVELYQVLHKAAVLQAARPDQPIVPVLVCRRAHATTYWMASQLGFVVIDMQRQFAGDVDEDKLLEIRNELQLLDLWHGSDPSIRVLDRLRKTLPKTCIDVAATWRLTCAEPQFTSTFAELRKRGLNTARRVQLKDHIVATAQFHGLRGW